MSTPEQFAAKLNKLARELPFAARESVNRAATIAQKNIDRTLAADIGTERRMSGLGRKKFGAAGGGEVTVGLRRSTATRNFTAYVGPVGRGMAGAWGILEGGTVAHPTGGKTSTRIARRGRRKDGTTTYNRIKTPRAAGRVLMRTPYGPRWGPFLVGGSPAKHTFSRGARPVRATLKAAAGRETGQAVRKAFR